MNNGKWLHYCRDDSGLYFLTKPGMPLEEGWVLDQKEVDELFYEILASNQEELCE